MRQAWSSHFTSFTFLLHIKWYMRIDIFKTMSLQWERAMSSMNVLWFPAKWLQDWYISLNSETVKLVTALPHFTLRGYLTSAAKSPVPWMKLTGRQCRQTAQRRRPTHSQPQHWASIEVCTRWATYLAYLPWSEMSIRPVALANLAMKSLTHQ